MANRQLVYEKDSERTEDELRAVAAHLLGDHGLTLYNIRDLGETYLKHGHRLTTPVLILECGDEEFGMEVIENLPSATVLMPHRISVYRRGDRMVICTLLPQIYSEVLAVPKGFQTDFEWALRSFERKLKAAVRDLAVRTPRKR